MSIEHSSMTDFILHDVPLVSFLTLCGSSNVYGGHFT